MSCFKLLNERTVEKGLMALLSEMQSEGTMPELPVLAAKMQANPGKTGLHGFNLFQSYGSAKPYTWYLTKPKLSLQEAVRIYESVANQPVNELDTVGELASHIYPRGSEERKFLAKYSLPVMWLSPALLMAATFQYIGAEVEASTKDSVRMRMGPALIEITSGGCFSNQKRIWVPQSQPASEEGCPTTYFPDITTTHPVLRALAQIAGDYPSAPAITAAAHALEEGILSKAFFNKIAKLEGPLVEKVKKKRRTPEMAGHALNHCLTILDQGIYDVIPDLYEAAVPDLLSFKQLQAIVGAPSQVRAGRSIRPETIENWKLKLSSIYEDLVDAKT